MAEWLLHQFAKLTTLGLMGSNPIFSICPLRLVVRTVPFHGDNKGSTPLEGVIYGGVIAQLVERLLCKQ